MRHHVKIDDLCKNNNKKSESVAHLTHMFDYTPNKIVDFYDLEHAWKKYKRSERDKESMAFETNAYSNKNRNLCKKNEYVRGIFMVRRL